MFARVKKFCSTIRWTPRTMVCVIVLVLVPGGIFIAPLLIGRRFKRESQRLPADGAGGLD